MVNLKSFQYIGLCPLKMVLLLEKKSILKVAFNDRSLGYVDCICVIVSSKPASTATTVRLGGNGCGRCDVADGTCDE